MRFPVNLSSEPFRRDRPIFVASAAVGVMLVALLAALSWIVFRQREQSADARRAMAVLDGELAQVAREQAQVSQALARPENAEVLNETVFLNSLILRKAVSWTQIFADLETVLPHNVRVISVRPQIGGDNQVQLDLFVGSQTTEPVIQMLMKLESSPLFGKTAIANWLPPSQTEPFYRYRLTVNYAQRL
jgi:type IV pilus assembly protein PilN